MRNTIDGYIIYVKSMYMTKHSNLEKETVGISIKIICHINIIMKIFYFFFIRNAECTGMLKYVIKKNEE